MADNLIILNDIIGLRESSVETVREKLNEFAGQPVKVEINSPGGLIGEGLEIFHLFLNFSGHVTMHVMSIAASMASIIPLAGNRITAEESTLWFIHNAMGGAFGDSRELQKESDVLKSMNILIANIITKRTNIKKSEITNLMNEETFFFGKESLTAGLVDEIIELPEKDKENRFENKSDAIAYAKLRIKDCNNKLKNEKEDFEKISAMMNCLDADYEMIETPYNNLPLEHLNNTQNNNPDLSGKNKNREANMTLDELKAKHPEIYNQIFNLGKNEGVKEERENTAAHMEWVEVAPEAVANNIKEGVKFTMQHLSAYNKAGLNVKDKQNREDDNPDTPDTPDGADTDLAEDAIMENVKANLGIVSKEAH